AAPNEQTSVRLTVEDTGCGIDQAHVDRIFDPFFTTKSHGMCLVLSICRSIIEAHGGRLWVLPRSPFGTAFHLTLPSAEAVVSFSGGCRRLGAGLRKRAVSFPH